MAHCGITIGSLGAKQSSEKRRKGAVGPNGLGNVDPFSLASWVVPSTIVSRPVSRRAVDIHHLFYLSYDAQIGSVTCSCPHGVIWCVSSSRLRRIYFTMPGLCILFHRNASVFMQA